MKSIVLSTSLNSFTFDQLSTGAIARGFEGFESSEVREVIADVPGGDGADFIRAQFGRRLMKFEGELPGTSRDNSLVLRRNLLKVLKPGSLITMKFTTYDDLALQVSCMPRSPKMPYTLAMPEYMIQLIAPDYRFFSQTLNSEEILAAGTETITNDGDEWSNPTFTITGPGTTFTVTNTTTGESFILDLALAGGETVVVDTVAKTVLKGVTNVYANFSGDFFRLPGSSYYTDGDSSVSLAVDSGSTGATKVTIAYRDTYIGV